MPIRHVHAETVHTTPERAFAAIDNLALTAKWLPPCVSLEKSAPGPTPRETSYAMFTSKAAGRMRWTVRSSRNARRTTALQVFRSHV